LADEPDGTGAAPHAATEFAVPELIGGFTGAVEDVGAEEWIEAELATELATEGVALKLLAAAAWTGPQPPKGPTGFWHRTMQTFDCPATVPVQARLAGIVAARVKFVATLLESPFVPGTCEVTCNIVHVWAVASVLMAQL
jgi:hypothetical protein